MLLNTRIATLIFIITISLFSCSKDKQITSCKLLEFINVDSGKTLRTYQYNSQDQLHIVDFIGFRVTEFEYADNQVVGVRTSFLNQSDSCLIDEYEYNDSDQLIKIYHKNASNSNCTNPITFATTDYFYGNNELLDSSVMNRVQGQIVSEYNKEICSYDENRNIVKKERYKNNELHTTIISSYDDNCNPLFGYFQNGKNNLTTEEITIPSMQTYLIFSYHYEDVNDLGVPTKMFETNSYDIYLEKEFELKLDCE